MFSIIESWSVRRWVCGYQARNYPDLALDLLKQAASTGENTSVTHRIMDRLDFTAETSWRGSWPNDEKVKRSVLERKFSAQKTRFTLEAIERHITPRHAGLQGIRYGDLQIEHLMPQGWKSPHWPIAEDSGAVGQREELIQTLGNLTFLVGSLNAKLSNGPWSEKREAIRESDNLYLNKDLLRRVPDTWDKDAILERGRWMAEQICEIWPHAERLRLEAGEP